MQLAITTATTNSKNMNSPVKSIALRHATFGDPNEVLRLEEIELPSLAPGEVSLRFLAAPINPADFGRINGTYGQLAQLPAAAGIEGVAKIMALGSETSQFQIGDRVLAPSDTGSWQTHANASESSLFRAPESLSNHQAAMFWINPATAWRLMHDFADLKPGDYIIQNAATSAVGKLIIQFANHLGIRTVNLVRNPAAAPELLKHGATHVFEDNRDAPKAILKAIDPDKCKLGLNAVGGSSALSIAKVLADGAPLVTYGGMDRDPAPFPTRYLIFNNISLHGFWVSQWYQISPRETIEDMHQKIAQLMKTTSTKSEVDATYPLQNWQEALAHSQRPGKPGKVLFDLSQ